MQLQVIFKNGKFGSNGIERTGLLLKEVEAEITEHLTGFAFDSASIKVSDNTYFARTIDALNKCKEINSIKIMHEECYINLEEVILNMKDAGVLRKKPLGAQIVKELKL